MMEQTGYNYYVWLGRQMMMVVTRVMLMRIL